MSEWIEQFTSSPQNQFLLGVAALVFGSRAILSEENLKGKFWGIGKAASWIKRRQEVAAEAEVAELKRLRREVTRQHRYIVWVTSIQRNIEIMAADKGITLPPPPFRTYSEWAKRGKEKGDGEQ